MAKIVQRVRVYHYITILALLTVLLAAENAQLLGITGKLDFRWLLFGKAALWVLLGIFVVKAPAMMPSGLIRMKETVTFLAFIFGGFHLLSFVILGFVTSMAKNSNSLSPTGIVMNLVSMLAALFGAEMCRAFLINSPARKKPFETLVGLSLLFAVFNIPLGGVKTLSGNLAILDFITASVLPELAQSFAASCLAFLGGALPAMAYLGVIRVFSCISPYIPDPTAIPRLLFNVLLPLVSLALIYRIYNAETAARRRVRAGTADMLGWVAVSGLSVVMVWFAVGVFPIFPSVILTGSMEPEIMPGDIVLVQKISGESAEVGDVIMYFTEDGVSITHRVIERIEVSGAPEFVMKGDNNNTADPGQVVSEQIRGRVIGLVPKLGKLVLLLRGSGNK